MAKHNKHTEGVTRKRFLQYAGLLSAMAVTGSSCRKEREDIIEPDDRLVLGDGDAGRGNFIWAIEDLSIQFYKLVLENPYVGMTATERAMITDIYQHELLHREYFNLTIVEPEEVTEQKVVKTFFTEVDFTDRTSVLTTAMEIEDLSVAAYNGMINLVDTVITMGVINKLISVEARHAAYIRELLYPNSFADASAVDTNGLDKSLTPGEVSAMSKKYAPNGLNTEGI